MRQAKFVATKVQGYDYLSTKFVQLIQQLTKAIAANLAAIAFDFNSMLKH
ncbi:hypothetical protein [Virgibacillus sp. SK37]|nr:hypothetical protein [Virgibacillus sp. SK37]